jgi:hypothetical protein
MSCKNLRLRRTTAHWPAKVSTGTDGHNTRNPDYALSSIQYCIVFTNKNTPILYTVVVYCWPSVNRALPETLADLREKKIDQASETLHPVSVVDGRDDPGLPILPSAT